MCGSRKYPNLPQEGFSEIPKQMGSKFLKVSMNSDWNFWRDRFGEGGSNKKKIPFWEGYGHFLENLNFE